MCFGPARNKRELSCVRQFFFVSELFACFYQLDDTLNHEEAHDVKEMIYDISNIGELGLSNFRFAITPKETSKPWNPYFPLSYYGDDDNNDSTKNGNKDKDDSLVIKFSIGVENEKVVRRVLDQVEKVEDLCPV